MKNFKFIDLAEAETMSEHKLQLEIGKRSKYLKEQLGMDATEAADFIASLLNMGVAMDKVFKSKKIKKNIE